MEKIIILAPLSFFVFQLDFLDHANIILFLITFGIFSIQFYFRRSYFYTFHYVILNLILTFCYVILFQLVICWFLWVPFWEWDVFPNFIAQYLVFSIFLIPFILIYQIIILRKSKYTYGQILFYLISPSLFIFLNKNNLKSSILFKNKSTE